MYAPGPDRDERYRFRIHVLALHPSWPVIALIDALGAEPDYSGEPGKLTLGSFWSHRGEAQGSRWFFKEVNDAISWLEARGEQVREIIKSGGRLELIVELPGDVGIRDTWEPSQMQRAVAIGVSLGVEVFPNWDR
jgi:hypothetical protein